MRNEAWLVNEKTAEIQQWIARKLSRTQGCLREAATSTFIYRPLGLDKYGEVTISAHPSEFFSFTSKASWPDNENYEQFVADGILDTLISFEFYPVLGASFTLEKIGWHEIESVPIAYYYAAREATKEILKLNDRNRNVAY